MYLVNPLIDSRLASIDAVVCTYACLCACERKGEGRVDFHLSRKEVKCEYVLLFKLVQALKPNTFVSGNIFEL